MTEEVKPGGEPTNTPAGDDAAAATAAAEAAAVTKAADDKKAADEAAANVVPDKYELNVPKDSTMDPSELDEIATYARAQGLSNEAAQKVVDRQSDILTKNHEAQVENLAEYRRTWIADTKSDKEIGGEKYDKTVELSTRVLERFGTPELQEMLDNSGFGDHPEIKRLLSRIGTAAGDDMLVVTKSQSGDEVKSDADLFYDKTANK